MGCRTDSSADLWSVSHFRDTALLRSFCAKRADLSKSIRSGCAERNTCARSQSGDCVLQQRPLKTGAGSPHEIRIFLPIHELDLFLNSGIIQYIPEHSIRKHKCAISVSDDSYSYIDDLLLLFVRYKIRKQSMSDAIVKR